MLVGIPAPFPVYTRGFIADAQTKKTYDIITRKMDSSDDDFEGFGPEDIEEREFEGFGPEDLVERENDSDISLGDMSSNDDEPGSDSDADDHDTADQTRWVTGDDVIPCVKRAFTGPAPGPKMTLDEDKNEMDFLHIFFPQSVIVDLAQQTNLYVRQQQARRGKTDTNWRDTTPEELVAWFGIRVYMSIVHLPSTEMYWSQDYLFGNFPVSSVMKRDRFDKISQYFHAADVTQNPPRGQPGHDKLAHVRQVMELVRSKCKTMFDAHQNTSIDEAMIAFRGRLGFRQYIPSKPTKYGIKVWMRCDPENGYTNDFQVYTGKAHGEAPAVGLGGRVVKDMCEGIEGKNHIVNCDNFFTSPVLCTDLLRDKIYVRGTVRIDRKEFPKAILHKKCVKNQGDMKIAQKGPLLAVAWQDKKTVNTLSTADDPATIRQTVQRKQKNGNIIEVPCPSTIRQYNDHMNGVDRADQLRTMLSTYRTSRRWWLYLFWFLFDVAVTNAFVLMRDSVNHQKKTTGGKPKVLTMLHFRKMLAKLLIGDFRESRKRKRTPTTDPAGNAHWPVTGKRGRCRQCSKSGQRHESKLKCSACQVSLCVDCFEIYHMQLNA